MTKIVLEITLNRARGRLNQGQGVGDAIQSEETMTRRTNAVKTATREEKH